jgi:hypothetical protein
MIISLKLPCEVHFTISLYRWLQEFIKFSFVSQNSAEMAAYAHLLTGIINQE